MAAGPFVGAAVLGSLHPAEALTQILQGYRALMLARSRVKLYLPALIWAARSRRQRKADRSKAS